MAYEVLNTRHPACMGHPLPPTEMQVRTTTHIRDKIGYRYQPTAFTLKERDTKDL